LATTIHDALSVSKRQTDAVIAYAKRMNARPRYHANDASRDVLEIDLQPMVVSDARGAATSLDEQGFVLIEHESAVTDFEDAAQVWAVHRDEIADLVKRLSGADAVIVSAPGVLRFAERSNKSGALNNSRPARFAHVDISDATAAMFADRSAPEGRTPGRFAHYNVWRVLTPPPQDVPLAVCDASSVAEGDLIEADAVFDEPDKPEWSFEGLVVAHNSAHRWCWFSDMTRDEALVFKTHDSSAGAAHCVPHVAFDHRDCPTDVEPRTSIEMRAIAFWL
jgi:hypothetical protein